MAAPLLLLFLSSLTGFSCISAFSPGSNYIEYSSNSSVSIVYNSWVRSPITVSNFPVSYFGSTTAIEISIDMNFTDCSKLAVILQDTGGYATIIGYYYKGATSPCITFYNTTVMDSQQYETVYGGSGSIPCPPTSLTADASYYLNSTLQLNAFEEPENTPFTNTYVNDPTNGQWTLMAFSELLGGVGHIFSWKLRLYCLFSPL